MNKGPRRPMAHFAVDPQGEISQTLALRERVDQMQGAAATRKAGGAAAERGDLCFKVGGFDRTLWTDLMIGDDATRETMRAGRTFYEAFDTFGREVFHRLRAHAPEKLEEPASGSGWAEVLHDAGEEEIDNLRARTVGDRVRSGYATSAICDTLINRVEHPKEKIEDPRKDEQVAAMLRRMAERAKDKGDDQGAEEMQGQAAGFDERAQTAAKKAQGAADMMDGVSMRSAFREGIQRAQEQLDNLDAVEDCFGFGNGANSGELADPTVARKLVSLLNDKAGKMKQLRKVIDLAGRMKREADSRQRAKPREGVGEPVDVTRGDNLLDLMPESMLYRAKPLRRLFWADYVDHSLLIRKRQIEEPKKQGPIVVCVDSSGSMRGDRHAWAMATALAYLQIAIEQKRSFAVVHFASSVLRVDRFVKEEKISIDALIKLVSFSSTGGGTSFQEPLGKARDIIRSEKDFKDADIILITDGQCSISDMWEDDFNAWRTASGARTFSILIGMEGDSVNDGFSDKVVSLDSELRRDGAALDLYGEV